MAVSNASSTMISLSQKRRLDSMKCGSSSKLLMFLYGITSIVCYILHNLIIFMKKKADIAHTSLQGKEALP